MKKIIAIVLASIMFIIPAYASVDYDEGYNEGYNSGYEDGYDVGKTDGEYDAIESVQECVVTYDMISSIVNDFMWMRDYNYLAGAGLEDCIWYLYLELQEEVKDVAYNGGYSGYKNDDNINYDIANNLYFAYKCLQRHMYDKHPSVTPAGFARFEYVHRYQWQANKSLFAFAKEQMYVGHTIYSLYDAYINR